MPKLFRIHISILSLFAICTVNNGLNAQSLDNLKDQQPVLLNGFISTNQVLNSQSADNGNINSYNSYYTGSLNFNFYGINAPFTFIYSNNQGGFTHPFNQYGIHPSYKWIKGHIGYSSMSFTPYTLNGHLFLGAGVEIDPPGLFYGSAMHGILKRAVEFDSINISQPPSYKRMGYGFKVGVSDNGNHIDVSLFRAYDITNSLHNAESTSKLRPEENSVMSVTFSKQLITNLKIQGELASSYLTTDSRTDEISEQKTLLKPPTWFMPVRASTINRHAFKTNLTYQQSRYSFGLGYERIDPEYRTLGAYYFTNNMENITLNFSSNFFENKITFSGNTGLQKDNLDKSKMNNTKRIVGAGNVNIIPNEKLNLNIAYSNFSSFTNVRSTFDYINETTPYQNYDTLNFRQISQNTNLNSSYQLSNSKVKRQTLSLNLTWQVSNDEQGNDSVSVSSFYNTSASYIINFTSLDLTCNTSFNYNLNAASEARNHTLGPVIGFSKLFFEKSFRTSLTTSYNTSKSEKFPSSKIYNIRLSTAYSFKKQHNFNVNFLYQKRHNAIKSMNTMNLTFGYVFNFNAIKQKNSKDESKKL